MSIISRHHPKMFKLKRRIPILHKEGRSYIMVCISLGRFFHPRKIKSRDLVFKTVRLEYSFSFSFTCVFCVYVHMNEISLGLYLMISKYFVQKTPLINEILQNRSFSQMVSSGNLSFEDFRYKIYSLKCFENKRVTLIDRTVSRWMSILNIYDTFISSQAYV